MEIPILVSDESWEKFLQAKRAKEKKAEIMRGAFQRGRGSHGKEPVYRLCEEENKNLIKMIRGWVNEFVGQEQALKMLEICDYKILILETDYYDSKYIADENSPLYRTHVSLEFYQGIGDGFDISINYSVHSEGRPVSFRSKVYLAEGAITSSLVQRLQPELIMDIWDSLRSGKVWEFVKKNYC